MDRLAKAITIAAADRRHRRDATEIGIREEALLAIVAAERARCFHPGVLLMHASPILQYLKERQQLDHRRSDGNSASHCTISCRTSRRANIPVQRHQVQQRQGDRRDMPDRRTSPKTPAGSRELDGSGQPGRGSLGAHAGKSCRAVAQLLRALSDPRSFLVRCFVRLIFSI
jgi:hypothetical protein